MKRNIINKNFLEELNKITSKKSTLVKDISDILNIEKVSVYRRLRGEIDFTVNELVILAQKYGISIDSIINKTQQGTYKFFPMQLPQFDHIGNFNLELIEQGLMFHNNFFKQSDCEIAGALSTMPFFLYAPYRELTKFFLFKWAHHFCKLDEFKHHDTMQVPEELYKLYSNLTNKLKRTKYTFYIWDQSIIYNLVNDIKYYQSMDKISSESVKVLKNELFIFLDDLENILANGKYENTDNKFDFYISSIHVESTQLCMISEKYTLSIINMPIVQASYSNEKETCKTILKWIKSIKIGSTLISDSAEKERTLFLQKQRDIVDTL